MESKSRDTHKPFPRTLPNISFSWPCAVFRYSGGLGSNISRGLNERFLSRPYEFFWKVACDIGIALSLRLRGGFHLHAYDVIGSASSSDVLGLGLDVGGWKVFGDIATRA